MVRSSHRHEEITEVAVSLAEAHSVAGVTTAALARRLKFTEAALYRHFPGKNAILAAALDHLAERLLATMLIEVTLESVTDPADVPVQLQRHIARFARNGGVLLDFLLHASVARSGELKDAGERFLLEYVTRMEHHFDGLQSRGLLASETEPAELARMWLCQLLGGFIRCRLSTETWDPVEQVGFKAFVAGLQTPAARTV